ncbi:hypothetical protein G7050_13740 [Dysgonomonas sp. HDW5A]|uniref:hypothetical protein n=1 Tax=unclassified Dysgonomonas TaxID=2630389 RepID=UPI00140CA2CC|nr:MULTISPECIES: hypothetical protein [unclassified Dysgonomonas]QIK55418.1 hypothetical protein G7051_14090 [Dysgonomonas sp. HDW5B]QIK60842.1 hypothetical protein G7050_13740 [Dysgonomonas sp. HDW5A]
MNRNELALRSKLLVGLSLSYTRLIEKKQIEDGNLIFSKNGKIVKVKARKLSNNIEAVSAGVI